MVLLTISVDVGGWSAIAFILETLLRHKGKKPENGLISLTFFIEGISFSSQEIWNKQDVQTIKEINQKKSSSSSTSSSIGLENDVGGILKSCTDEFASLGFSPFIDVDD